MGGVRQVEADVDEVYDAARGRRGVDQVGDLVGAERDRHGRVDVGAVELAGVDVDTRRDVDRHHRDPLDRCQRLDRVGTQAGPAPDPDDPVHHDLGSCAEVAAGTTV